MVRHRDADRKARAVGRRRVLGAAYPAAVVAAALLGYSMTSGGGAGPPFCSLRSFSRCAFATATRNLWPLGIAMFAILAVPAVIAARLAARFGPRSARGDAERRPCHFVALLRGINVARSGACPLPSCETAGRFRIPRRADAAQQRQRDLREHDRSAPTQRVASSGAGRNARPR